MFKAWSMPGRCETLVPPERWWKRCLYFLLALMLTAGFAYLISCFWTPANGGVDQHGYLVGGKMIAREGTTCFAPVNPLTGKVDQFLFVGHMWIGTDLGMPTERYYPKYPLGLPALVAVALKIGGPSWGVTLAYLINPLCMSLAVLVTYLLARLFVSRFLALLAALVVATSPVTLTLANNPNSHASTLLFVAAGMYCLFLWWHNSSEFRALAAGLLLGYAVTIRYTEGLLLLPLLLVLLFNFQWRRWRSYLQSLLLLAGWAAPVLLLVFFNWRAFGSLTGYDPTNESTGFQWDYFLDNWQTMLRRLGDNGLGFFFPLALAGLVGMIWWHWRVGLVIASWIIPNVLVYTAYYWAPEGPGVGYMRFFLTIFPPLAIAAFWLLEHLGRYVIQQKATAIPPAKPSRWPVLRRRLQSAMVPVMAGLLTNLSVALSLDATMPTLVSAQARDLTLEYGSRQVVQAIPPGSVIFSPDRSVLHHLDFLSDYLLYTPEVFSLAYIQRLPEHFKPDDPQGLQPERRLSLYSRFGNSSQLKLNLEQRQIITTALDHQRRCFIIVPGRQSDLVRRLAEPAHFNATLLFAWSNPIEPPERPALAGPRVPRRRPPVPPRMDYRSQIWNVYEITRKPVPVPTTRPAPPARRTFPPPATQPSRPPVPPLAPI